MAKRFGLLERKMQLSTRYGLAGIGALALLTVVHRLRDNPRWSGPTSDYLLGTLPNFAAAIAIAFVLLSIWTNHKAEAAPGSAKHRFLICASISGVGLLAWEAIQTTSDRFVFDLNDIGATALGILVAGLLFWIVTPKTR
ncbi:hypothetical protein [Qipengyuania sp.]|uniref:hypothetical protein n=1 Tax=Qipengyuania sp. TaxID=2004515 RepID=UPI003BAD8AB4